MDILILENIIVIDGIQELTVIVDVITQCYYPMMLSLDNMIVSMDNIIR